MLGSKSSMVNINSDGESSHIGRALNIIRSQSQISYDAPKKNPNVISYEYDPANPAIPESPKQKLTYSQIMNEKKQKREKQLIKLATVPERFTELLLLENIK